jgi:hypothetical protein
MKKRLFFLICILLVVAGYVLYKDWRHDLLRKKIPNLVFLKSDSLYRITYGDLYVDEIEGEIIIKNLQLSPDTTYKKATDSTLPRNLLRVTVPELHVSGVKTDAALLTREVNARKITLSQPVVTMYTNKGAPKIQKKDSSSTVHEIYKVLLRGLQKINVDTIKITGADYHICKWPAGDTFFSSKTIDAQLYHLNISDSTSQDSSRVLFAKHTDLLVSKIRISDKKGLYNYVLNEVQMHSTEKVFSVKTVFIAPLLNEAAFMRAAKWQTDRLNFDFTGIRFTGTNIQALLDGNLEADQLVIKEALFKIFRDKSYPSKRGGPNKAPNYPHQQFAGIPVVVDLRKVVIQHGYIEYKEKNPQTASSGKLHFNNVKATLMNVTNREAELRKNSVSTVHFNGRFLNKIPLSATLQLYTGNSRGKFTIRGNMDGIDAPFFNNLTKPLALMMIDKGRINRLEFNLSCNNYSGNGTVLLLYEDLKIKLLKPDDDQKNDLEVKGLASFLANVSIKNNNPGKNKSPRVASVAHSRIDSKGMFNLIWKTIFSGVIKTVGIEGKMAL